MFCGDRKDRYRRIIVKVICHAHEVPSAVGAATTADENRRAYSMLGMSIYRTEHFDFGPCRLLRGTQAYRHQQCPSTDMHL